MNRRSFLKTAGALAAAPWALRATEAPDIRHVVLVMMENRSFDHFLGWLPNADGKQAGLTFPNKTGGSDQTFGLAPDFTCCTYSDPDHSYSGARLEVDGGKMDGFLLSTSQVNAIGYYEEQDLPFLAALARNYTTCDRYFPSILGPTFSNRIFQHAGATDRLDDSLTFCKLPTIWDNLAARHVSHRYYFGNVPFLAFWGLKYLNICSLFNNFISDCAAGTLPAVSFIDPSYTIFDNLQNDDHPFSDVRNGDAFLSKVFRAITSSPNWPNTVMIINFDEWGGFFDHVPPPRALAPNSVDPDLVDGKALLGCRVPCIVVSPWTLGEPTNPQVNHTVFDHTSVLKLIESVFNVPPVAARESSSDTGNLLEALQGDYQPEVPALPDEHYVWPSRFCLSSINPSGATAVRRGAGAGAFQRMVQSGMTKGFPGYR